MMETVKHLVEGRAVAPADVGLAIGQLLDGNATPVQTAALLIALESRPLEPGWLTAVVRAVRKRATTFSAPGDTVDTCGTGGDGAHTFNISTAAALVAAACGVRVAKHGNRAVSSACGSADVLAQLGVPTELAPAEAERCLRELGITFLFAPKFHPGFKAVAAVRRELGIRTVFNLVGPLVNPARVQRQVVGVFAAARVPLFAEVLVELGVTHAWVVHGAGTDEIALHGETVVNEVRAGKISSLKLRPEDFGVSAAPLAALRGGSAEVNARIVRDVFAGQAGPPRDAVVVNAAAALVVAGAVTEVREGARLAAGAIDSGAAGELLARWSRFVPALTGQVQP